MDLEAKAPLYSNFLETLNGLVTIRAFGWGKEMEKRNMALLDASQRPYYLLFCIQQWLALVVNLLVASLAVILVALIVKFRDTAEPGLVGVALISIMTFSSTLAECIRSWTSIETSLGAVARIKSFVDETTAENLPQETQEVPANWPASGSITFSNLSASYTVDLPPALRDITLSIAAGQKLGICGASGSGKSSFVAMLFHMLEITSGSVQIDNFDLSLISRQILRERLTVIPQEPIFLKGSIRQNLDPLSQHPDDANLISVLEKVGLWEILNAAGGLRVMLEADDLMSHGQKQLFCLARAMLRRSSVLVIDEATASVDLETDRGMMGVISTWSLSPSFPRSLPSSLSIMCPCLGHCVRARKKP